MRLVVGFIVSIFGLSEIVFAGPPQDYGTIANRNAFGLTGPPTRSNVVEKSEIPANLRLTGIVTVLPKKRAYFVIAPDGGGQKGRFLTLAEGERADSIEVIGISERAEEVRVRCGGEERTLTFAGEVLPNQLDETGQGEPGAQHQTELSLISYSARHQDQPGWGIGQRRP